VSDKSDLVGLDYMGPISPITRNDSRCILITNEKIEVLFGLEGIELYQGFTKFDIFSGVKFNGGPLAW
jgi:hypothetical protein